MTTHDEASAIYHTLRRFFSSRKTESPQLTLELSSSSHAKPDKYIFSHPSLPLHRHVLEHCPSIHTEYRPPFWVFSPYLHAALELFGHDERVYSLEPERQVLTAPDGATILLNFFYAKRHHAQTPVLLIIPGTNGGWDKPYVARLLMEAHKKDYHVVVLTFPGCYIQGKEINHLTAPRFYSSFDTLDVLVAIKHIDSKFPNSPFFGISHSMGASMLVKALASEEGQRCRMDGCISISNPWDFNKVFSHLESSTIGTLIGHSFFKYWNEVIQSNIDVFTKDERDFSTLINATNLGELEQGIANCIYGVDTVENFYSACSCVESLERIKIPLLVVAAMDDPIVPVDAVPIQQLKMNPNCLTILTKEGGHTGWYQGRHATSELSYADQLSIEFIDAILARRQSSTMFSPSSFQSC